MLFKGTGTRTCVCLHIQCQLNAKSVLRSVEADNEWMGEVLICKCFEHMQTASKWHHRAVWIITVSHRLKSKEHGSMAALTAPDWTYGRSPSFGSIVCYVHAF